MSIFDFDYLYHIALKPQKYFYFIYKKYFLYQEQHLNLLQHLNIVLYNVHFLIETSKNQIFLKNEIFVNIKPVHYISNFVQFDHLDTL